LKLVRQVVVQTLDTGFISHSDDLFASGHCRHSEKWRSLDDRRRMEDERGGAVVTVIRYPAEIDGAPLGMVWRSVRSPSAWEVLDELKEVIASSNRSIKCGAEIVQAQRAHHGNQTQPPHLSVCPCCPSRLACAPHRFSVNGMHSSRFAGTVAAHPVGERVPGGRRSCVLDRASSRCRPPPLFPPVPSPTRHRSETNLRSRGNTFLHSAPTRSARSYCVDCVWPSRSSSPECAVSVPLPAGGSST
jgi:hypothetical protein